MAMYSCRILPVQGQSLTALGSLTGPRLWLEVSLPGAGPVAQQSYTKAKPKSQVHYSEGKVHRQVKELGAPGQL